MVALQIDRPFAAPACPPVLETSADEGRAIFDQQAQLYLGIRGAEFLRRWNAGEYRAELDQPNVMELVMLLPLVQAEPAYAR